MSAKSFSCSRCSASESVSGVTWNTGAGATRKKKP